MADSTTIKPSELETLRRAALGVVASVERIMKAQRRAEQESLAK